MEDGEVLETCTFLFGDAYGLDIINLNFDTKLWNRKHLKTEGSTLPQKEENHMSLEWNDEMNFFNSVTVDLNYNFNSFNESFFVFYVKQDQGTWL